MQQDRTYQNAEDNRTRQIIRSEISRAMAQMSPGQRPRGLVRREIVNGYVDGNGNFVEYAAYDTGGGYDAQGMR